MVYRVHQLFLFFFFNTIFFTNTRSLPQFWHLLKPESPAIIPVPIIPLGVKYAMKNGIQIKATDFQGEIRNFQGLIGCYPGEKRRLPGLNRSEESAIKARRCLAVLGL